MGARRFNAANAAYIKIMSRGESMTDNKKPAETHDEVSAKRIPILDRVREYEMDPLGRRYLLIAEPEEAVELQAYLHMLERAVLATYASFLYEEWRDTEKREELKKQIGIVAGYINEKRGETDEDQID
jgi:ribonucleotide reductase beta subunit family protein with ferritin-like domain